MKRERQYTCVCEQCGVEFPAIHSKVKYCSQRCRQATYIKNHPRQEFKRDTTENFTSTTDALIYIGVQKGETWAQIGADLSRSPESIERRTKTKEYQAEVRKIKEYGNMTQAMSTARPAEIMRYQTYINEYI